MKIEEAAKQGHTGIEATCTGNRFGPGKGYAPLFDDVSAVVAVAWIAPGAKVWLIEQDRDLFKIRTQDNAFTGWLFATTLELG